MFNYVENGHNLKGGLRYERFRQPAREAIVSHFVRELENPNALEQAILRESGPQALSFIRNHIDLKSHFRHIVLTTRESSFVDEMNMHRAAAIININNINNIQHPNSLFRSVNSLLPAKGLYIGTVQTNAERKEFIFKKAGRYIGQAWWYADFLLNRVLPRFPLLDRLYYFFTNGKFHAISKAEVMGRLVFCGFKVQAFQSIGGTSYFVAVKAGKPLETDHPSYYPIIGLLRVGKDGRMIRVYKIRTMHPYSEYLQDMVVREHGYNGNGKPADDFRVTQWGKLFRTLWIDEMPQIINILKGEMKLVGIRPLSKVRFNELPADLQKKRIRYKPGCVPPYVALNMPEEKMSLVAERMYIRDWEKQHVRTDILYFLRAVRNIALSRIRSC